MENIKPFYTIVASDDDRLVRHTKLSVAISEGKRLARQEPDKEFFLLRTVERFILITDVDQTSILEE